MDEEVNQKISQFIDDELSVEETLILLKNVNGDAKLKQKMSRYQILTQVVKNESCCLPKNDFLEGVKLALDNEPSYLLPPIKLPMKDRHQQRLVFALAASVAMVAVLATKIVNNEPSQKFEATTIAVKKNLPLKPTSKKLLEKKSQSLAKVKEKQRLQNNRFNDYLQAHDTSHYTNGTATFQPRVQAVSYRQD